MGGEFDLVEATKVVIPPNIARKIPTGTIKKAIGPADEFGGANRGAQSVCLFKAPFLFTWGFLRGLSGISFIPK